MPRTEPVGPDTRFECIGCGDTMVNEYPESDATPDAFELERGECQPYCEYVRTDLADDNPLTNLTETNDD